MTHCTWHMCHMQWAICNRSEWCIFQPGIQWLFKPVAMYPLTIDTCVSCGQGNGSVTDTLGICLGCLWDILGYLWDISPLLGFCETGLLCIKEVVPVTQSSPRSITPRRKEKSHNVSHQCSAVRLAQKLRCFLSLHCTMAMGERRSVDTFSWSWYNYMLIL